MLYIVATPIGNMKDISYRAIETLKSVDYILCEDTRHSLKLLNYYEIKKPLVAYHKFNELKEVDNLVEELNSGKDIALISDAGTPLISDPGNVLTKVLRQNNIKYTIVPGATACISALILSGFDTKSFTFIGFLPEKKKDRVALLEKHKNYEEPLIFYSAPHDVLKDVKDLFEVLGNRNATAIREITKVYEEAIPFKLGEFTMENPRGEFVIVVEGGKEEEKQNFLTEEEHINLYLKRGYSKKDAIKEVAKERGVSKNSLYKYTIND